MAWDKTKPDGDVSIGLGDDAIRDNNDAIEAALGAEHVFATGGASAQTGRHKFVVDTTANINSMSPAPVEGSIALDETIQSGLGTTVPVFFNGSTWEALDVGVANVPHTDTNSVWESAQWAESLSISPSVGLVAVDMSLQQAQRVTISGDVTISTPTGWVSTIETTVSLTVTMSGAGHTISWGANYVTAYGIPPAYDNTSGAVNVFHITKLFYGGYMVSSSPGLSTF